MATGNSLEDLEAILETEQEENVESSDEGGDGEEESSDEEEEETDEEDDEDGGEEDGQEEEEGGSNGENVEAEASDDEDDDDDSEENDDEEDEEEGENGKEEDGDQDNQMDGSDSGGEEVEKCPICLSGLRRQDLGTPESCDHTFCLECIQEWAKNVNTCPVDRQVFHLILARHAGKEKIFKQFPVANKEQENEEEEEDDPTYCEICGQSNQEDRLLLCDGCDSGYHCDCLTPPLAEVPVDAWFCPHCQARGRIIDPVDINLPRQARRQIGRTLISERVRRFIQDARAERAERRRRIADMIDAQEEMEGNLDEPGPSSEAPVQPRPFRERKTPSTTRKKKTTKRKTTERKTTRKKKITKRKAKGKKKVARKRKTSKKGKGKGKKRKKTTKKRTSSSPSAALTVSLPPPSTVKGRIADRLGLSKPPIGRAIPLQKVTPGVGSARDGPYKASDVVQSSFSIRGNKDELYSFAEMEGEERQIVNRPAIPAEQLLSQSARLSHTRISITPTKRKVEVSESVKSTSSPSFDLLGSIMMNQDLLAKGGRHITINRDGSLSAKSSSTARSSPKKSICDKPSFVETSSDGCPSSTSISVMAGSSENQQQKSPSTKSVKSNYSEVEPNPKNVDINDFNIDTSLSNESPLRTKPQTCTTEGSYSDDELLNLCLKSEELHFQRDEKMTDGVIHSETKPLGSTDLDFQDIIDHKGTDELSHLHQVSHAPDKSAAECEKALPNFNISSEGNREEGEATDSNEEGEIVSEDEDGNAYKKQNYEEDEEEGEIIEEEYGFEDNHSDSKCNITLLAGKTHFAKSEGMKLSTANESITQSGDGSLETQTNSKQNQMEINVANIKKEVKEEEEEEEEEDFDPYNPQNGSFLVAKFLQSLVTNEFDRKKEVHQRREARERAREEEEKKKLESKKGLSDHKISILDFIGNAGARFGVVADSQNNWSEGRERGRLNIRPVHFGARRSIDEDSRGSRTREMRENSFIPVRNGYERASDKIGERPHFQDRKYTGTRSDFNERRSHSQRYESLERTGPRRIRGEKRKREDREIHGTNGHFERDLGKRSYIARDKRRKYEERNDRRFPKYQKRTSEEDSESGTSSSSSGSDSEEGSSSGSSSSGISPTEVPAMPNESDDSPCPTPPSVPPPPPPPLPPRSPSPQPPPPPPPQTGAPQSHIPHSVPSQHHYAPNHSSVQTHLSYSHPNTASSSAQPRPGQPHPSAHPSAYPHHHPIHPHLSSSNQNPPRNQPLGYPHSQTTAYSSSSYPHGHPYHTHPHSQPYPSSYYPNTTLSVNLQRSGVPAASTHSHATSYAHYRMHHPSTSYSSTASTVPHPQPYSAHYPSSHTQQAATSHPYYSTHPSVHRHPVSQSYPYPNHQHPTTSTAIGTSAQTNISHPSQPHYSQHASNSNSSAVVRNEHMQSRTSSQSQKHLKRTRESPLRLSPKREVKSTRLGYRPSPPTVRGVATSDRVASNILHDEVKKGFRQLVEDAVRSALRPAWSTKKVSKEAYKDIFKKCVEKVCGSKETVVQQDKIQSLVDAYVSKARKSRI